MNFNKSSPHCFGNTLSGWAFCLCAMLLAISVLAASAQAQNPPGNTVFDLVPIGSTGPVTNLSGNSIVIPGGGVVVELELRISNWGSTGDGLLHLIQATIDGSGYCSGVGDPLYPVGYPGAPVLACPQGLGCPDDGDTCDQGGFIRGLICALSPNAGDFCIMSSQCPGGVCAANPDYVFSEFQRVTVIAFVGLSYQYAGVITTGATKPDVGLSEMFGTLLVEIPVGAVGTYNINFLLDNQLTFNGDGVDDLYAVVNLNGATITVTTGSCCFNIGPGSTNCRQNVTQGICDGLAQPSVFRVGQECSPVGSPDSGNGPNCPLDGCGGNDAECDDSNACTEDRCLFDTCTNTNFFDSATECCDPTIGSVTIIDDLDPCTIDVCDNQSGQVSHDPVVDCSACMSDVDCDDMDVCTANNCNLISGECTNPATFNAVTQCCDTTTGAIVTFGDGDPCTNDFCDAITLQVSHTPISSCMNANNRYVTFFPNRGVDAVNYLVTETASGRQKWLLPPTTADDLANSIARLTDIMPTNRVWDNAALYIGDCIVSPGLTYDIRSTTDGTNFSTPVLVDTTNIPTDGRSWADCVGTFNVNTGNWGPSDGLLTAADILAVVQAFQLSTTSVPVTWADLSPERPNGIVNSSDILDVVLAFQFAPYPHSMPMNCP